MPISFSSHPYNAMQPTFSGESRRKKGSTSLGNSLHSTTNSVDVPLLDRTESFEREQRMKEQAADGQWQMISAPKKKTDTTNSKKRSSWGLPWLRK